MLVRILCYRSEKRLIIKNISIYQQYRCHDNSWSSSVMSQLIREALQSVGETKKNITHFKMDSEEGIQYFHIKHFLKLNYFNNIVLKQISLDVSFMFEIITKAISSISIPRIKCLQGRKFLTHSLILINKFIICILSVIIKFRNFSSCIPLSLSILKYLNSRNYKKALLLFLSGVDNVPFAP